MNEWVAYELCPFYSISVISGRLDADNERSCAMKPSFPPLAGFEPGITRAEGQGFSYWAAGLPKIYEAYVHTGSNLKVLIAHPCRMCFLCFVFFFRFLLFFFFTSLQNVFFLFFFFFLTFFFLTELSTFMPI